MFKRKFTKGSVDADIRPAFDEPFWTWYVDSCTRSYTQPLMPNITASGTGNEENGVLTGPLPYNNKKYHHSSTLVVTIRKYFETLKLEVPLHNQIVALLKSPFTQGDVIKTFQLIRFFQLSSQGLFLTNENKDKLGLPIQYVGAENWENVMCYLDALLFSMFANLESFEPILFISNKKAQTYPKELQQQHDHEFYLVNQLSGLLRVYVSLLRLGNLITTDLTMRLCEVLSKLGFTESMSHKQQDCASLFEFLTETLSMPLLTFKIDIKHGGKFNKDDDEKYSRERILFVSIPDEEEREMFRNNLDIRSTSPSPSPSPSQNSDAEGVATPSESTSADGSPIPLDDDSILLEECLEHYFSNSISVKRELERRATLESIRLGKSIPENSEYAISSRNTSISSSYKDSPDAETFEIAPNSASSSVPGPGSGPIPIPRSSNSETPNSSIIASRYPSSINKTPLRTRSSTLSIWSLNEVESNTTQVRTRAGSMSSRRASLTNKEVSLPAWMFLRLLPFYTDDNEINNHNGKDHSIAKNSKEFVNRRPILPICLKRYSFHDATASKAKRRIIIPPVINLPNFVADEDNDDLANSTNSFKLILESAVCHRGTSVTLGHFVSVIRKDTNNLQETDEEAHNATWYLYDDMKKKSRVIEKTFKEIFDTEWPYMLFYRLVSNDECDSTNSSILTSNAAVAIGSGYGGGPVIPTFVPPGSKGKYWNDNALSPIVSSDNLTESNSRTSSILKFSELSSFNSNSSTPCPEISPLDNKYIDVRNKYFWYVIDNEKNYFKELSIPSRHGTREPSISISPQFRRNSQWSDNSVKLAEDPVNEVQEKLKNLSSAQNTPNVTAPTSLPPSNVGVSQKWRLTSKSKTVKSPKEFSVSPQEVPALMLDQTISPASLGTGGASENHMNHIHESKHKFKKNSKKKGDDYRKEKCIIM